MNKKTNEQPSMHILHLIPNVRNGGGAQAILYRLILADNLNRHSIVTLREKGYFSQDLEARDIKVSSLELSKAASLPRALYCLWRILRRDRPDVVQTWMYHCDLIGGITAWLARRPVVWSLHHAKFEKGAESFTVVLAAKLCAAISGFVPCRVISCSTAGVVSHEAMGYDAARLQVVHNGYDTQSFTPRPKNETDVVREELGLPADMRLLGMAARFEPLKDHANLLAALSMLKRVRHDGWRAVLFGSRIDAENDRLMSLIEENDVADRVVLLGRRSDVIEVMRSLDLNVLSSRSEAFPNVLNESMLVGTPCVTTDVGDAALIVGETGRVVPRGDSAALAAAIEESLVEMDDKDLWWKRCAAARERVVQNFSIETMVDGYSAVWSSCRRS